MSTRKNRLVPPTSWRTLTMLFPALLVLGLGLLAFAAAPASAHHNPGHGGGGPGGGGEDPPATPDDGWVYFYGYQPDRTIYRSSPDDTTLETVFGAPADYGCPVPECGGAFGSPSHDTHDGDRWYAVHSFFGGPDNAFPTVGHHGIDIDIVREGQATGITVLDGSAACNWVISNPEFTGDAGGSDAAITWSGVQWADADMSGDCETFVAAGIFRADVVYSGGAMVGIQSPTLAVETPSVSSGFRPDVNGDFDWSPDGAAVVYTRAEGPDNGGLYVAPLGSAPSSHTRIAEGALFDADWSPDQDASAAGLQTTIAFTGWNTSRGKIKGGTWSTQPDGSGTVLLAEAVLGKKSSQSDHVHYSPRWSPAGSHVAYVEYEYGGPVGSEGLRAVRRMAANGSDNAAIQSEPTVPDIRVTMAWTNLD